MNQQTISARVERTVDATPERVFDAFLDPDQARHFMFTMDGPLVRADIEPIIGGKFTLVDRRNGDDVLHTGEFLDVDRPRRLIFTLSVPKYSQSSDQVRIVIEPEGDGSRLTLDHEMQGDEATKRRAEDGWQHVLDRLARTLAT